jgi:hypothetical protein
MKVINLNSRFELTEAQISFAESVIICGEDEPIREDDSISILMNEIPVLLVDIKTQEEYGNGDILGFYQHSARILGFEIPVIGLCLEKIINEVKTDEELIILIAKVLIHEFAHAKMKLHPSANYYPIDEFYKWMEEPMANLITLEYFKNYDKGYRHRRTKLAYATILISPFDYVKEFISKQPDNYRLGLDLFEHRVFQWWIWRNQKDKIQYKTKEKKDWLDYVKANVGKTDKVMLDKLFEELHI